MHFRRLHVTRARIDAGTGPEAAMKSLSPPVFFKQEAAFRGQAQRWSLTALAGVLQRLKRAGGPVQNDGRARGNAVQPGFAGDQQPVIIFKLFI